MLTKDKPGFAQVADIVDEKLDTLQPTQHVFLKHAKKKKVFRAGFIVSGTDEDSMVSDTQMRAIEVNLNQYKSDRATFEQALSANGIKPIGILPTKFFQQLCHEFGLVRFEHFGKEGHVPIEAKEEVVKKIFGVSTILFLVPFALALIPAGILFVLNAHVLVVFGAAIVLWFASTLLIHVFQTKKRASKLVKKLWPSGATQGWKDNPLKARIILPPLTKEAEAAMETLEPITDKLCTAAIPDAIKIDTGLIIRQLDERAGERSKVIEDRLEVERAHAKEQRRTFWRALFDPGDPVCYSANESGTATAVYFQFGEFPREKEFIARVKEISDAELLKMFA